MKILLSLLSCALAITGLGQVISGPPTATDKAIATYNGNNKKLQDNLIGINGLNFFWPSLPGANIGLDSVNGPYATSLTLSNISGPGLIGRSDSGYGPAQKIQIGTGLKITGSGPAIFNADFPSMNSGTNGNGLAISGLIIPTPQTLGQTFVTANTYSIDFNGAAAIRIVATNNVVLSFVNVPSLTNGYVGPIVVTLTNAVGASTNTLAVNWPVANRDDWIEQQNPALVASGVYELKFWWNGYAVKGSSIGPSYQENEYVSGQPAAVSSGTNYVADFSSGSFAVVVAANDVFFLNSTNRPSVQYVTARTKQILIRASGSNRRVDLNSSWKLVGTTTTPITVTNATSLLISLTAHGPSETNVFVGATYAQ